MLGKMENAPQKKSIGKQSGRFSFGNSPLGDDFGTLAAFVTSFRLIT
jgi:hypothetical protein